MLNGLSVGPIAIKDYDSAVDVIADGGNEAPTGILGVVANFNAFAGKRIYVKNDWDRPTIDTADFSGVLNLRGTATAKNSVNFKRFQCIEE